MLEMKPEVRSEWCKALRSGEYVQAQGHMRTDPDQNGKVGYCCLGVLTDLYLKAGNPETYKVPLLPGSDLSVWNNGVLTEPVCEWAGLANSNPLLSKDEEIVTTAVGANDGGSSFKQIADLIDDGEGKTDV